MNNNDELVVYAGGDVLSQQVSSSEEKPNEAKEIDVDIAGTDVVATAESSEAQKVIFQCKHCPKTFETFLALGGHATKVHPRMSAEYTKKMTKANNRVNERYALRMA